MRFQSFFRRWFIPSSIAAFISIVSLVPVPETRFDSVIGFDKLVHVCLYGVLAYSVARAWSVSWARSCRGLACASFVAVFCYGAMIEGIQIMIPYRSGEPWDLAANAMGSIFGSGLFACVTQR